MTDLHPVPKQSNRDPEYLAYFTQLCEYQYILCVICGRPAVPHHVRNKRVYGDRENLTPLCDAGVDPHHTRGRNAFHQIGCETFDKRFKKELPNGLLWEAKRLDKQYRINGRIETPYTGRTP